MSEMRFTVNNPQTDDRGVTALIGVDHPGRGDFFFRVSMVPLDGHNSLVPVDVTSRQTQAPSQKFINLYPVSRLTH